MDQRQPTERMHDPDLGAPGEGFDDEAFCTLYGLFFHRLVETLTVGGRDRASAEDLAQEAFFKALTNARSFDRTRPFWPWLKAIAARIAIDDYRRRERERDARVRAAVREPRGAAPAVARAPGADFAPGTPDKQRRALWLRYVEGRGTAEAAVLLEVSVAAFDQLVFRGRSRVKRHLAGSASGESD